ncbi:MAG TPA: archaemetzincin [Candidatus Dormibacteraeota bacterium]|nr:archaemetzincin [Candidatus Dormibacteraeota bacterium]
MNLVHLLPVGTIDLALLQDLCAAIPRRLPVSCEILPFSLDPTPSYHPERQQFHSSEILQRMQSMVRPKDWRFLAVASVDLYIPILKYVFGEAQMGGPCAVVSTFRLRQEFYGLDRDDGLLGQRLLKESVHELGHTLDVHHCQDYRCVMASSHAVEWIDLRESALCEACAAIVEANGSLSGPRGAPAHHKPAFP